MDEFFKGLVYAAKVVNDKYKGKPIDRAMQKFLSAHMDGKKFSLDTFVKDEHALERVVGFNRFWDEHKHLAGLDKKMESIVEHLGEHPKIIETESIKDIIKICLIGYDNRTIEIDNYEITPDGAGELFQDYNVSCIANYKHHLFDAKDAESWKRNIPLFNERMVIYAKEGEEASALFKEIPKYLGDIVAERKKYSQYASRDYVFNNERRSFEKSSIAFENSFIKPFKKMHLGADPWFRTDSQEVNGQNFMHLALIKGQKVTVSYRPKWTADKFFKELDAFHYDNAPLFLMAKD